MTQNKEAVINKVTARAEHAKLVAAKTAKLNRLLEKVAAAREERDQSIRDAYAAGLEGAPLRLAAGGIGPDRISQIIRHRR